MPEELGYRTPAREIERLKKRLEGVEGVSKWIIDVGILSVWALAEVHRMEAFKNPKDARKSKDFLLGVFKGQEISPVFLDALETMYTMTCDFVEGKTT